ncbi:MAG: nitrate- and nitrite sensing domain-containing protein, partial [Rhodospirillales bacterium]|nr:nitrate- and nitrite sensing domain-containing protein [Rhodospirillales bacterium]
MKSLNDRPIGLRIVLALVLPVLGLLAFSGWFVTERIDTRREAARLERLGIFATQLSAMVHELQRERGASALFLGSKGQSFGAELSSQRKNTDSARGAYQNGADTAAGLNEAVARGIGSAAGDVAGLERVRQGIDSQSMDPKDAIAAYTRTISGLLSIVKDLALISSDVEIANAISAYVNLMEGKERAGQERAIGSAGFAAGSFSPDLYRRYVGLASEEMTYYAVFRTFAVPVLRSGLDGALKNEVSSEVERMRRIGYDSVTSGKIEGIKAPEWFAAATRRIDLLKQVEDQVARELVRRADDLSDAAATALTSAIVAVLALLAVSALLVTTIVRGITRPLLGLEKVMHRLAEGDTSVGIEGTRRGDEIGAMSRAVEVFRENKIRADQLAEEQRQEQLHKERRQKVVEKLIGNFDVGVGDILEMVAAASTEMRSTAESMSSTAEETSRQTSLVSNAADEAAANVQTVASAAEELSASISEISQQVARSAAISHEAVNEAERTNATVTSLAEAASRIGEVVSLINDIASQTNL